MVTWGQVLTSLILKRLEVEKFSESGKLWLFYVDEVGEQFTFALPSVFVFPFGGSMITRVSIDPPSMAHWHRGEVCKKQKADVFCCQANAEGCPCPVLAGWPNFPAIPKMLQFVILFLELVIGCRNPSEEISPKMIKKYPRWNQNTLAMFIYTKEAQD